MSSLAPQIKRKNAVAEISESAAFRHNRRGFPHRLVAPHKMALRGWVLGCALEHSRGKLLPDRLAVLAYGRDATPGGCIGGQRRRRRQGDHAAGRRHSKAPEMGMAGEVGDSVEIAEGDVRGFEPAA